MNASAAAVMIALGLNSSSNSDGSSGAALMSLHGQLEKKAVHVLYQTMHVV